MTRKRSLIALAISIVVGSNATSSTAQITFSDEIVPEFVAVDTENEILIEQIPNDSVNDVGQTLINGTPVNPREFPGVLRMVTGGTCTAALIGPSTVLFAAHCLQGKTRIRFRAGGTTIRGHCSTAPGYDPFVHHQDWAMCLLERRATGIVYETVDVKVRPNLGETLMLSGYGCIAQGGGLDGRLRIGFSNVIERPSGLGPEPSAIYTFSSIADGGAVLCPGDSGGPLFRSGDDTTGSRQIVAVNSRTTFSHGVSIFSATASPQGASFIKKWTETHNQKVCGVNREIGCK